TCRRCGKYWGPRLRFKLHAHHVTYERWEQPGEEHDLLSVCGRGCHKKGRMTRFEVERDRKATSYMNGLIAVSRAVERLLLAFLRAVGRIVWSGLKAALRSCRRRPQPAKTR